MNIGKNRLTYKSADWSIIILKMHVFQLVVHAWISVIDRPKMKQGFDLSHCIFFRLINT